MSLGPRACSSWAQSKRVFVSHRPLTLRPLIVIATALGTGRYKHRGGFSTDILNKVKPVYADLCSDELLTKCLHGKTQNANECFNGMLWQRLPKDVYVGLRTVLFGLYDCICHFNNGNSGTRDILMHAGVDPGYYTTVACHSRDRRRLKNAKRHPPLSLT